MFKTQDGSMPLELLSDGFQNVISWCGDLLYRITETFEDYQNQGNDTADTNDFSRLQKKREPG